MSVDPPMNIGVPLPPLSASKRPYFCTVMRIATIGAEPDSPEPASFPEPLLDAVAAAAPPLLDPLPSVWTPPLLEPLLLGAPRLVSPPVAASSAGFAELALPPPPHAVAEHATTAKDVRAEDGRLLTLMSRSVSPFGGTNVPRSVPR